MGKGTRPLYQSELVLVGRVLTGDLAQPRAEAVAILGDRIVAVGTEADILPQVGDAPVLGGPGAAVVPGFVDAHLHFAAFARRGGEVDCSRERAGSIADILALVERAAAAIADGGWIRAFGYDEAFLAERRAPTTAELDRAAPRNPVRLLHRTGHAAVLNAAAFRQVGLAPREIVLEPGEWLRGKLPRLDGAAMKKLATIASERLLAAGVTSFHDVTPGQDDSDVAMLRDWTRDGTIRQRIAVYGDAKSFDRVRSDESDRFAARGIKIMVGDDSAAEDIAARVAEADRAGAQVALHAVEGGPLIVALAALARLGAPRVRQARHRIEHASLCPPPLCAELAASGAAVVTHPLFLARFGAKYRAEIAPAEHEWLYPLCAFAESGVPLALGSDAPIAPPEPLANVQAAVLREDEDGRPFAPAQRISAAEALAMHTVGGATLAGWGRRLGVLAPGRLADAVLLDRDPTEVEPRAIAAIRVRATVVAGKVVWTR